MHFFSIWTHVYIRIHNFPVSPCHYDLLGQSRIDTVMQSLTRLIGLSRDLVCLGSSRQEEISQADSIVRTTVSSAQRLDLISVAGGVGCSHVAARLAVLLAHRRGARVLGIDAGNGGVFSTLTHAARSASTASQPTHSQHSLHAPVAANTFDETSVLVGADELRVLRPSSDAGPIVRPQDWRRETEPVVRYFDIVVTDWGHRYPGIDFEEAIDGARVVALVCRADRASVEVAVSVADAVAAHVRCDVCVVDVADTGRRAALAAMSWTTVPVWYVPFMRTPAEPVASPQVRSTILSLTSSLMASATGVRGGES